MSDEPRQRYELEETDFNEVPRKWRRFYRYWGGPDDQLAPNEVMAHMCTAIDYKDNDKLLEDQVNQMAERLLLIWHTHHLPNMAHAPPQVKQMAANTLITL